MGNPVELVYYMHKDIFENTTYNEVHMLVRKPQGPTSSSTIPEPSPLIHALKPAHLTVTALDMVINESKEATWLRAIQRLTAAELGITDAELLIKFKALMILQAHQLFFQRQIWEVEYLTFVNQMIQKYLKNFASALVKLALTTMMDSMKDPFINKAIGLVRDQFIPNLAKLIHLQEALFLPADHILSTERDLNEIASKLDQLVTAGGEPNQLIAQLQKVLGNDLISSIQFKNFCKSIHEGASRFDRQALKKIQDLKVIDVAELCNRYGLSKSNAKNLILLHKKYIAFNDDFQNSFEKLNDVIRNAFSDVPKEFFSQSYQIAFEILKKNPDIYITSYLCELYFQQARNPRLQYEIYKTLQDETIPMANKVYPDSRMHFSMVALSGMAESIKPIPDSLQDILDKAYAILITPFNYLQQPQYQPALQAWLPTGDAKQEEQKAIGHETPAQSGELSLADNQPDKQLEVFKQKPSLQKSDLTTLSQKIDFIPSTQQIFAHINPAVHGKQLAIDAFRKKLNKVESLDEIAILLNVAEPYINSHRNILWDTLVKKRHTHSWKEEWKEARVKALKILKGEVAKNSDTKKSQDLLLTWRQHSLFAKHRNEWLIQGAWGRTQAQRDIDGMLKKLPRL